MRRGDVSGRDVTDLVETGQSFQILNFAVSEESPHIIDARYKDRRLWRISYAPDR
jgi:hypothetical protein